MNSEIAFIKGLINRDNEQMVFDWDKAAKIIKTKNLSFAQAGLQDDLGYTAGIIWDNGIIYDDSCYLASTWAMPVLVTDTEEIPCYKMQHEVPNWNEYTLWPKSAKRIIQEQEENEE